MTPVWHIGHSFSWLAVPSLTARETSALIAVVVSLLFFRAFRERYLIVWGSGWIAYGAFLYSARVSDLPGSSAGLAAFSQADFVLAVALFSASALMAAQSARVLKAILALTALVVILAALRPMYLPANVPAGIGLEAACRLIAVVASVQLLRGRLGRIGAGPLLFTVGLLTLNLSWPPFTDYIPNDGYLLAEVIFGSSMVLIALDESRVRSRRLELLNELTGAISRTQNQGPMMQSALEQLKSLAGVRAAWFAFMDGQQLIPAQHIGLSSEFVRVAGLDASGEMVKSMIDSGRATIIRPEVISDPLRAQIRKHGIGHLVMVPVHGKKSVIGMLALGCSGGPRHSREELEFLETVAQKLGISLENLRLLEQVLRSQRQWMNTFDSIQDLILAHDADFRILKTNQALLQKLEKAPADVLGNPCEAVLPHQLAWSGCPYCQSGTELNEGPDPCFGGQSVVSTSSYADQGTQQRGVIHVIHDTSDRYAAEEKYRMLFEQAQEGVFVATLDGRLLDCNDAFVTMLGYASRDELMTLELGGVLYSVADQNEAFRKELEAHNYVRNFEITVRRKDGTLLTAAQSCFAFRDSAGLIERYQGFVLDITEKKRSEDEMRRRNRELNALNAMAVIATQSFDLDEILNLTLRQVISLFGAETGSVYLAAEKEGVFRRRAGWGPRSEARIKLSEITFPEGFGDLIMRSRAEVVTQDFLPHLPPALVEFICADRLPYWIWVLFWSKDKPIGLMGIAAKENRQYSSNDENLLVAISRQLATTVEKVQFYEETCRAYDDLRRTQEQLLQSEKMSAVGQLISGVAHELNNPLTAILGYAQLLENAGLDDRNTDYVKKLFKQAQRTHRVVQNLLSFARQRKPEKQEIDLRKVLEETLTLREYDLKVSNITLERRIASDLPSVVADPHQLEQVFLNIINNAIDAMLENGNSGTLKVVAARKENLLSIAFEDSGPGIKDTSRIFDPFYTTKSVGKGTGLGLSICYGIVKEHGGEILARNRDEGGATIEVRLPASEKAVVQETAKTPRREAFLEGCVLLVEDEEAVLEFERDVLVGAGAKVTTSTSIDDTKEKLRTTSFDVLVLNGRMPGGCSIQELHSWISKNVPGIEKKLIFTFSSIVDAETRSFLQGENLRSLAKPFEVADLIAQVRSLLQKEPQPAQPDSDQAKAASAGN